MSRALPALVCWAVIAWGCASDDAPAPQGAPPDDQADDRHDPGPDRPPSDDGRGDGGEGGGLEGEGEGVTPPIPALPECGPEALHPVCVRGICETGTCVEPESCDRVSHCLGDRVCVLGRCVDPCVTHADCAADQECTDSLCGPPPVSECGPERPCTGRRVCHSTLQVCVEPVQCRDDRDCDITRWGARHCDGVAGRCVYCVGDIDCSEGRACEFEPHADAEVCVEPERCEDHIDCLSGRRCDTATGACVFEGGCIEDGREPNGTLAEADNNQRSHLTEANYTRLTLCEDGEDWYRVRVPPGRGLQATMKYLAPFDELDLAIWDERGRLLARGDGPPNKERAVLPGSLPAGGFRYLQVTSRRGGTNEYSLDVDLPTCVDDLGEEDDGPDAARALGGAADGWICGPEVDWYQLEAPARSIVHVELLHGGGIDELRLMWTARPDAAGAQRFAEPQGGGAVLREQTVSRGPRWLAVSGAQGVSLAYRIEVSILSADCAGPGMDDAREDNDGRLSASELLRGANRLLKACPGDPDWHWIELEPGDGLEIQTTSDQPGAIEVALLSPASGADPPALIARPDPADGVLRIGRAAVGGRHLVRARSDVATQYRLDVEVTPGGFCLNDGLEVNDDVGQEAPVTPGEHDLILCPADKDRFAMHVDEGSVLDVGVRYDAAIDGNGLAGLSLAVFDPEGRLLGESAEGAGHDSVRGLARLTGIYIVRVGRTGGDEEIPYRLSAWVEPVNDTCEFPVDIADGQVIRASTARARDDLRGSCGGSGPDVVYRLELEQPSGVELTLTPTGRAFPGALHLRTECRDVLSEVKCEREVDADGVVTLQAPYLRGGVYHLIVDSVDRNRGGNFELTARVVPGGICFPDDSEPDDDPALAPFVGEGAVGSRTLCEGDEDWLRVQVPEAHDLVVSGRPDGDAGDMELLVLREGVRVAEPLVLPGEVRIDTRAGAGAGIHHVRVRGGPGEYDLTVSFVAHQAPEDSCVAPPLLQADLRVAGDTSRLHDFARGGACGNLEGDAPSTAPEAVYRFQLGRQSSIKATVTGEFDRVLYLRSQCAAPDTEQACVDDWIAPPEVLTHPHLDAGEYFLFVDGFGGPHEAGAFELTLDVRDPYFPPDNDTCETAAALVNGVVAHGTTRLAEDDYSSTCTRRRGHAEADVVYHFRLEALTRARLTLDGRGGAAGEADAGAGGGNGDEGGDAGEFDSVLYLRRDCRNDSPPIASVDQPEPQVIDAFLGAGDYYAIVDGWREGEGDFELLLELFEPQ